MLPDVVGSNYAYNYVPFAHMYLLIGNGKIISVFINFVFTIFVVLFVCAVCLSLSPVHVCLSIFVCSIPALEDAPVHITSLKCSGFETNLLTCPHEVADNGTCQHDHDIYLSCSMCAHNYVHVDRHITCRVYSLLCGIWNVSSSNCTIPIKFWAYIQSCLWFTGKEYPIQDGDIRLVDGHVPYSGRLEIIYHGLWMSVCGKLFNKKAADVACMQIGYTHAEDYCTDSWWDATHWIVLWFEVYTIIMLLQTDNRLVWNNEPACNSLS